MKMNHPKLAIIAIFMAGETPTYRNLGYKKLIPLKELRNPNTEQHHFCSHPPIGIKTT